MSIDDDLPTLVRRHLRSVWALEILLLLRNRADHPWTVAEVVRELRASNHLVSANLQSLQDSGLILRQDDDAYVFRPASPLLDEFCRLVDETYRARPVTIINLISAPEDRLQKLAEAFKFGRREP